MDVRRITFFTPTFRRDIERFALLRESIERCGIAIPHVAVVHEEDLDAFRQIPFQQNLRLLSTREVLPGSIERRRTARGYRRRDPRRYVLPRPLRGWNTQQVAKVAAPDWCDTEGIVYLDSDRVFVKPVEHADFWSSDGRMHLYETDLPMVPATAKSFFHGAEYFGLSMGATPVKQYAWVPFCLHREVGLGLREHMEKHVGRPWSEALIQLNIAEWFLLGMYARHVDGLRHQVPANPDLALLYFFRPRADADDWLGRLETDVTDRNARVVLINSATGVEPTEYRRAFERMWQHLG